MEYLQSTCASLKTKDVLHMDLTENSGYSEKEKKKGVEKQQLWSIFASFASNEAEKTRVRKWKVKKRTKKTRSLKEKDTKTRSQ